MARFDSEAKALGQIGNPHIIGIHNYGISEEGAPYLVMDFIKGFSLEDEIKSKGFIEEPRALKIFAQVCDGLRVAHMHGLIHRDLKPSNIMITRDSSGEEKAVIVDFGIAKRQAAQTKLTETGDVFGTPLYMSPEQCLGNAIDERADLYSLGC
jgi:serine/threonine protein kinase